MLKCRHGSRHSCPLHVSSRRQHKLNVMTVHAPSNNGKYTKPCPINHLLENKNKLVLQQPSTDLSISIVFKNSLAWWS